MIRMEDAWFEALYVLTDHLNLADIMRLRRALGKNMRAAFESLEMRKFISIRMGLTRTVKSTAKICDKMNTGRRCVECGRPCNQRAALSQTRRVIYCCELCHMVVPKRHMMSRRDVRYVNHATPHPLPDWVLITSLRRIPLAKRTRSGAHMYWATDVIPLLSYTKAYLRRANSHA